MNVHPVVAANRFGLGARPGDIAGLVDNPVESLRRQLEATPPALPASLSPTAQILKDFFALRQARQARVGAASDGASSDPVMKVRELLVPHYVAQASARVRLAATTDQPFRERLVHFWSNHFAVSVDKVACLGIAGSYENEAIRPHVTGHFGTLLAAVERHPAMILYLDNHASVGPNSDLARRPRARGRANINENLAREILELHTLGVDGGYAQADVLELAMAISGWSLGGGQGRLQEGEPGTFQFRDNTHEPGRRTVLARRYAEGGVDQGMAVLADLAIHPATAKHLCGKLARHFIGDDVPEGITKRLAATWVTSGGHLMKVYEALLAEESAGSNVRTKLKTPWDYVLSAYRGFDVAPANDRLLLAPFEALGQRIWSPGSPAGWPDTAAAWDGADALMKRIEWASVAGDRLQSGRPPEHVAADLLGDTVSVGTSRSIAQAESEAQALTLLLVSPEFLRR